MIVTDLHDSDKSLSNRVNYVEEVSYAKEKIIEVGHKYKSEGYNVIPLFLGDIIYRSYTNVVGAINTNNFMVYLGKEFSTPYSVVGNHETSFYKDNPFWAMVASIESAKLPLLSKKIWQPRGAINIINIVDYLRDGEVTFHFNHHGTPITIPPKEGVQIGLFHQALTFPGVKEAMLLEDATYKEHGADIYLADPMNDGLSNYDYMFLGHFHRTIGQWIWSDEVTGKQIYLYYLGALGRTYHVEVNDNSLQRNIPVVKVEDGKFCGVDNNFITLPNRASCVKEVIVKMQKQKREELKERKAVLGFKPTDENPIQNIANALSMVGEGQLELYETLTQPYNVYDKQYSEWIEKARRIYDYR